MNRIEVFKQMLEHEPDNTMVLFGLANEYQKDGRTEDAVEAFKVYLAKADDEGAAWGMLADAYEQLGESDKAKESLETGVDTAIRHGHPTMAEEFKMRLNDF